MLALETLALQLEREYSNLVEDGRFEDLGRRALSHVDTAMRHTEVFFTPDALKELRAKYRMNWPHGEYHVVTETGSRSHEFALFKRRYASEVNCLKATNERTAARLWGGIKDLVEERYGQAFGSRADFALMHGIYESVMSLGRVRSIAEDALRKYEGLRAWLGRHPKLHQTYKEDILSPDMMRVANGVLSLIKDCVDPDELFLSNSRSFYSYGDELVECERDEVMDLLHLESHEGPFRVFGPFSGSRNLGWNQFFYLASAYLEDKAGNLSFFKALDLHRNDLARRCGIKIPSPYFDHLTEVPEFFMEMVNSRMCLSYTSHDPDPEFRHFMESFKALVLERWRTTARLYDSYFDFHFPERWDQSLISSFYTIRDGLEVSQRDNRVMVDRLPGVLRLMVGDGYLDEDEIDPPLLDRYPVPKELPIFGGNGPPGLELEFKGGQKRIATEASELRLLEGSTSRLPIMRDTKDLAQILDSGQEHSVVYKGDSISILCSYSDERSMDYGSFHRVSVAMPGTRSFNMVNIEGIDYILRPEKTWELTCKGLESLFDINSDTVPVRNYASVVDMAFDDFVDKHFKDLMALVTLHKCGTGGDVVDSLRKHQDDETEYEPDGDVVRITRNGHTYFYTFRFQDRFGYRMNYDSHLGMTEMLEVIRTIKGFLDDLGLDMYQEATCDEMAEAMVKRKIEEREFHDQHIEAVKEALKGPKLADFIVHVIEDDSYGGYIGVRPFPCSTCGRQILHGYFDLRSDSLTSVSMEALHNLSWHPQEFRNNGWNLRTIVRTLEGYEPRKPLFVKYPELVPEMEAWEPFCRRFDAAEEAIDDLYEEQMGVPSRESISVEEWEDNHELRGGILKNEFLHNRARYFYRRALKKARKLDELAFQLIGENPHYDGLFRNPVRRWGEELYKKRIYEVASSDIRGGLPRMT